MMMRTLRQLIKHFLLNALFWQRNKNTVYVFINQHKTQSYPDFEERCRFYLDSHFQVVGYGNTTELFLKILIYGPHRALFTSEDINKRLLDLYFFNVDYINNPSDGWEWHKALNKIQPVLDDEIKNAHQRFVTYSNQLPKFDSSLVCGTGPSLSRVEKLIDIQSYKIVCNTIVKDFELWKKLKPHFIVAGDAIYHYGSSEYAKSFRRDLKKCLKAHGCPFLYPALFHPFIKKEFKGYEEFLYPVPTNNSEKINNDLINEYTLPNLGNVLNLLLLPLGTTLAKKIYLIGFDGRAPVDKLFWSNSNAHSYSESIPDIQRKHPKFFDYFIDNKNPFKYVNTVHGDSLDNNLNELESCGYSFISLVPSYTATIQKRYQPVFDI